MRSFIIDMAIREQMRTKKENMRDAADLAWFKRARSSDDAVASKAFKERWDEIQPVLTKIEKRRLTKKLNIKP